MVKIIGNSVKAKYHIDNIGLRNDGNIIPLQAEILQIKKNQQNEYMILCKLKDGIFGKATETESVKLKTYDEIITTESAIDDVESQEPLNKEK